MTRAFFTLPPLAILALLFAAQLVSLVRHRLDYPIVDDWRYYGPGFGMPEALTLEWLFAPAGDTVHVTGKLLDWLIFGHLSHDYSLLAALSFGVFHGGWLIASVALCFHAARDSRPVLLSSLSVLLLTLAGAPYWVTLSPHQYLEPAIAYHQMLPMLALSILALLCVAGEGKWPRPAVFVLVTVITPIFALAYASGAVLLLLFGGTLLASWALCRRAQPQGGKALPGSALLILGTAAACLAVHVLMPLEQHHVNPVTEARGMLSLTPPWRGEFWLFFFALFDRAVLSTTLGWVSQFRGISIAVIVVVPAVGLAALLAKNRFEGQKRTVVIVLVAILISVLGYAALVSYGRAGFGKYYFAEVLATPTRVSLYAHSRFFYWWITAILPLSLIAWWLLLGPFLSQRVVNRIVLFLALWMLVPKDQLPGGYGGYFHHWNYPSLYERDAREVADLINRDFLRTQGVTRQSRRYERWLAMDPDRRNPHYRKGERQSETYEIRRMNYRSALRVHATFVDRWDLARKSSRRRK